MKNIHLVHDDRDGFDGSLTNYIDDFDPLESIPFDRVQMAGMHVIPPLIAALETRNLRPMIGHKLATVAKLHGASGGRMRRLIQTNDHRYHPSASPADTLVLALMRDGEPKGCIASRLLWCEGTLAEEMESGSFWATRPGLWGKADKCIVTANIARTIRACHIVFTGSVWLAQDVTGGPTLAAMIRLHHLWVICHWRWTWLVGMLEGQLARRHAFDVYGGMALDFGLWRTRPGEDDELHEYELTSCERGASMERWLRPEMGDLAFPIGRPSPSRCGFDSRRAG
jgi:hypothetical protein